jgi:hypothetical protein
MNRVKGGVNKFICLRIGTDGKLFNCCDDSLDLIYCGKGNFCGNFAPQEVFCSVELGSQSFNDFSSFDYCDALHYQKFVGDSADCLCFNRTSLLLHVHGSVHHQS